MYFDPVLSDLKGAGNYKVFNDIKRHADNLPKANSYLSMGKTLINSNSARLRITFLPLHSDEDIHKLVSALSDLWSQCAFSRAVA